MPTAQVELHHRYKSLDGVIDFWHREEGFRVCHEAIAISVSQSPFEEIDDKYFVILSSIDLGSKINVGRTTLLKSAPGRSCEMMCEST